MAYVTTLDIASDSYTLESDGELLLSADVESDGEYTLDIDYDEYGATVGETTTAQMELDAKIEVKVIAEDEYEGGYEITPTEDTQTMITKDLLMTGNVTINPIPSNYGRITWNGTILTVE